MMVWCSQCLEEPAIGTPAVFGIDCLRARAISLRRRPLDQYGGEHGDRRCKGCGRRATYITGRGSCLACSELSLIRTSAHAKARALSKRGMA